MEKPRQSPFGDLFDTNYAPSDAEMADSIKDFIASVSPDLLAINSEIETAMKALEALTKRRDILEASVTKHRALLSPIRQVPTNVLEVIFCHCLPDQHNAIMSPSHSPMVLTQVCQAWRIVCISMPSLWSSLHIPLPNFPDAMVLVPGINHFFSWTGQDNRARGEHGWQYAWEASRWQKRLVGRGELIKTWLSRAQCSLLSISLHEKEVSPYRLEEEPFISISSSLTHNEIISTVLSFSTQWKRLDITASEAVALRLVSVPASLAPHLKHLSIKCHEITRFSSLPQPQPVFTPNCIINAPNLTSLAVWEAPVPTKILDLPACWENVTVLRLDQYYTPSTGDNRGLESPDILSVLRRCPNLVSCRFTIVRDAYTRAALSPPTRAVVSLPELTTLELQQMDWEGGGAWLASQLSLPALCSLTVVHPMDSSPIKLKNSPLFILSQNYGRQLRELTFDYRQIPEPGLIGCLQRVNNVRTLNLSTSFMSRAPPQILPPSPTFTPTLDGSDSNALCPNLRSFSIQLHTIEFSESSLLNFVRARSNIGRLRGGGEKLCAVKVRFATYENGRNPFTSYPFPAPSDSSSQGSWPLLDSQVEDDHDTDLCGFKADVRWKPTPAVCRPPCHETISGPVPPALGAELFPWNPCYGIPSDLITC